MTQGTFPVLNVGASQLIAKQIKLHGGYSAIIHEEFSESVARKLIHFNQRKNIFETPAYVSSMMEEHNSELSSLFFVSVMNAGKDVGYAIYYLASVHVNRVNQNLNTALSILTRLSSPIIRLMLGPSRAVLVCGNPFTTNFCPYAFDNSVSDNDAALIVESVGAEIMKPESNHFCCVHTLMIKDFFPTQSQQLKAFWKQNFVELKADDTLLMPLDKNWNSPHDYEHALISKYRTRYHSVMKKSSALVVSELDYEGMILHARVLESLYLSVYQRVGFRMGTLPFDTLAELKKSLGNSMIVKVFILNEKPVALLTAFINESELDAHMIGFDVNVNGKIPIYQRILYEYIHTAIEKNCQTISFGRTAGEIKTSVGAVPVEARAMIKNSSRWRNFLFRIMFCRIKPASFIPRMAFKREVFSHLRPQLGKRKFN